MEMTKVLKIYLIVASCLIAVGLLSMIITCACDMSMGLVFVSFLLYTSGFGMYVVPMVMANLPKKEVRHEQK